MELVVHEKIDLTRLRALRAQENADPELCSLLDKFIKYAKPLKKGGSIGVNEVKLSSSFGRAYPKNGLTLALLQKRARNIISVPCTDFDIVNCHPTLLRNICKRFGIAAPLLDDYVEHRSQWLNKGISKHEMTVSLYGSNAPTEFSEVQNLRKEIQKIIYPLVVGLKEYEQVKKFAQLKKNQANGNSVISYILQDEETRIITGVIQEMKNKYPLARLQVYEYDGLKYELPKGVSASDVLSFMNECVRAAGVEFKIKPFGMHTTDFQCDTEENESTVDEEFSDRQAYEKVVEVYPGFIRKWNDKIWAYDEEIGMWTDKPLPIWKRLSVRVHGDNQYGSSKKHIDASFSFCDMCRDASDFFEGAERRTLGKLLYDDGVWDIENSQILPFSHEFFFTIKIHRSIPNHRDEYHILKLRKAIFEEPHRNIRVRNELMKSLAVALTGRNKDRRIVANLGGTGTGKSTLMNLFKAVYCGYFQTLKAQNFVLQKNMDANEHCGWLVDLRYSRIAMTSECPTDIRLDGNLLKTISGGDPIQARRMYVDPITFNIQSTVFFQANALAPISPMDEAMRDRIKAIQWKVQFKAGENRDETIGDYIQTREAADALFWIMADAYALWKTEGFLLVDEIEEFTKTFADEQDEFKLTFEENFEVGEDDDVVLAEHVYWAFKKVSKSQFNIKARLLSDYGMVCERRRCAGKWEGQKMSFVGIKLKQQVMFE